MSRAELGLGSFGTYPLSRPCMVVGNVIAPLLAVGAVVMAVISYSQGRGVARWAVTAVGLLLISGLTRLIEFWISNGTAGVQ